MIRQFSKAASCSYGTLSVATALAGSTNSIAGFAQAPDGRITGLPGCFPCGSAKRVRMYEPRGMRKSARKIRCLICAHSGDGHRYRCGLSKDAHSKFPVSKSRGDKTRRFWKVRTQKNESTRWTNLGRKTNRPPHLLRFIKSDQPTDKIFSRNHPKRHERSDECPFNYGPNPDNQKNF